MPNYFIAMKYPDINSVFIDGVYHSKADAKKNLLTIPKSVIIESESDKLDAPDVKKKALELLIYNVQEDNYVKPQNDSQA